MSDMLAMAERLAEVEELERLRREVAELRARWDDYREVANRAAFLGVMQWRPSADQLELYRRGMMNAENPDVWQGYHVPRGLFG
jgi:hypothetical protein